jgi:hypothetical protein
LVAINHKIVQKIESPEINEWLVNAINWQNDSRPLKVSNFLPKFDNYVGLTWKIGIIENFPFSDFIANAKSEAEIKNNREIWNCHPQAFNENAESQFVEISTEEALRRFKIPYHEYKNDGKLPWNTRAIRILESKIIESLSLIVDKIPENKNLILYWEDYYRYNIEDNLFKISKEEFLKEIEDTGFDASLYLYPESKNWCLINLEDLGFNILAFNNKIKPQMQFLTEVENFKLTEESELFRY